MNTTPWPAADSRSTLILADLERAAADFQHPPWWLMIRDARTVEVRASDYATKGTALAMDCDWAPASMMLPPQGRVMVVCHADDGAAVVKTVAAIRARP